jgi:hypothetical protein
MKRRIKVSELMQREGLHGEIVQLFHSQRTGMIHGDNGYDVTFNEESLVVGLSYGELSLGLKVSYGIFFATGSKLPTGINVQPAAGVPTATPQDAENVISARAGGTGVA